MAGSESLSPNFFVVEKFLPVRKIFDTMRENFQGGKNLETNIFSVAGVDDVRVVDDRRAEQKNYLRADRQSPRQFISSGAGGGESRLRNFNAARRNSRLKKIRRRPRKNLAVARRKFRASRLCRSVDRRVHLRQLGCLAHARTACRKNFGTRATIQSFP